MWWFSCLPRYLQLFECKNKCWHLLDFNPKWQLMTTKPRALIIPHRFIESYPKPYLQSHCFLLLQHQTLLLLHLQNHLYFQTHPHLLLLQNHLRHLRVMLGCQMLVYPGMQTCSDGIELWIIHFSNGCELYLDCWMYIYIIFQQSQNCTCFWQTCKNSRVIVPCTSYFL